MYEFVLAVALFGEAQAWETISGDLEKSLEQVDTEGQTCSLEKVGEDLYMVNCVPVDILI
jgi:hypothetical protein